MIPQPQHQPSFEEVMAAVHATQARITAERVELAERRARYEVQAQQVPAPLSPAEAREMEQYNAENQRSAAVIFWLAWLCLFGVGLGLLVTAGFLRDLRFGAVGLAMMLALIAAARKMGNRE